MISLIHQSSFCTLIQPIKSPFEQGKWV